MSWAMALLIDSRERRASRHLTRSTTRPRANEAVTEPTVSPEVVKSEGEQNAAAGADPFSSGVWYVGGETAGIRGRRCDFNGDDCDGGLLPLLPAAVTSSLSSNRETATIASSHSRRSSTSSLRRASAEQGGTRLPQESHHMPTSALVLLLVVPAPFSWLQHSSGVGVGVNGDEEGGGGTPTSNVPWQQPPLALIIQANSVRFEEATAAALALPRTRAICSLLLPSTSSPRWRGGLMVLTVAAEGQHAAHSHRKKKALRKYAWRSEVDGTWGEERTGRFRGDIRQDPQ